jgi:hypothetical protein
MTTPPTLIQAADFVASYVPPKALVRFDEDGDLEIQADHYWYPIERNRIDTSDKLVRWLLHLSTTKLWFTREHVQQLIEAFIELTGFRPHGL